MRNDPYLWTSHKPRAGWQADPTAVAELGLIGAWLFNEGGGTLVNDVTGKNSPATLTTTGIKSWWTSISTGVPGGLYGPAVQFGSGNFLHASLASTLSLGTTHTIIAWVWSASLSSAPFNFGPLMGNNSDDFAFYLAGSSTNQFGYADANNASVSYTGVNLLQVWNQIAAVRSGASVSLYANGQLVQTGSLGENIASNVTGFGYRSNGGYQGNELVDNLIFSNRALTAGEIATLYTKPFWWMKPPRKKVTYGLSPPAGIQYDAVSNSGYQSATSSLSWSHIWNGSNRFLAIDISMLSVTDTVMTMTYGGANCTFINARNVVGGTGRIENWRICQQDSGAPAAGSNTISVTISGSLACAGTAVSYTGVSQSSPTEGWAGNSGINVGTGTNATVSVTTVKNNDWVHAALSTSQSSGISSSQTSRNVVAGTLGTGANSDTGPITPAGSQTMTFTGEGLTSVWAIAGYGIVPYVQFDPSLGFPWQPLDNPFPIYRVAISY